MGRESRECGEQYSGHGGHGARMRRAFDCVDWDGGGISSGENGERFVGVDL